VVFEVIFKSPCARPIGTQIIPTANSVTAAIMFLQKCFIVSPDDQSLDA
jgi:hypothetical protein